MFIECWLAQGENYFWENLIRIRPKWFNFTLVRNISKNMLTQFCIPILVAANSPNEMNDGDLSFTGIRWVTYRILSFWKIIMAEYVSLICTFRSSVPHTVFCPGRAKSTAVCGCLQRLPGFCRQFSLIVFKWYPAQHKHCSCHRPILIHSFSCPICLIFSLCTFPYRRLR